MSLAWDYTDMAASYAQRPGYAPRAIERALDAAGVRPGMRACDVGAGTGVLTASLLDRGMTVVALEPNAAMRRLGRERLRGRPGVAWVCALGEAAALAGSRFDLVAFGSSFNVVDADRGPREARRLLHRGGHVLCVWNHRRLDDPLQAQIEALIRDRIPHWSYGSRRTDPTQSLVADGLFERVAELDDEVVHRVAVASWALAWRSHATLRRQAGERFDEIVAAIGRLAGAGGRVEVDVPYRTRAWVARARAG